jgi:hypothetical protein
MRREPKQFVAQGKHGPPADGYLAGQAEPGDCLDMLHYGAFVNIGSKDWPRWEKRTSDTPADGAAPGWRPLHELSRG